MERIKIGARLYSVNNNITICSIEKDGYEISVEGSKKLFYVKDLSDFDKAFTYGLLNSIKLNSNYKYIRLDLSGNVGVSNTKLSEQNNLKDIKIIFKCPNDKKFQGFINCLILSFEDITVNLFTKILNWYIYDTDDVV